MAQAQAAAAPAVQTGSAYWRAAGMTYIGFANLCAIVVRKCQKEPFKSQSLSRDTTRKTLSHQVKIKRSLLPARGDPEFGTRVILPRGREIVSRETCWGINCGCKSRHGLMTWLMTWESDVAELQGRREFVDF